MRIERNGVGIHVTTHGEGTPVLMLHGFPDTNELWRAQIPALTGAGYQVIAPDLRGFGESDKPEDVDAYGLFEHVADVGAVLDALDIERVHLVGHDWGTAVSWLIAALQPERVQTFTALSVGKLGMRERSPSDLRRLWYMFMFQFEEAEDYLTRNDWANFRVAMPAPDIDAVIDRLSKPGALRAAINIYRANVPPSILLGPPMDLPPVQAPTMGVWSSLDMALTEEQMLASAEGVSGPWRYERIDDVGHWIPLEAPDRLNALLLDFLPR